MAQDKEAVICSGSREGLTVLVASSYGALDGVCFGGGSRRIVLEDLGWWIGGGGELGWIRRSPGTTTVAASGLGG